jgi:hypothetical protein
MPNQNIHTLYPMSYMVIHMMARRLLCAIIIPANGKKNDIRGGEQTSHRIMERTKGTRQRNERRGGGKIPATVKRLSHRKSKRSRIDGANNGNLERQTWPMTKKDYIKAANIVAQSKHLPKVVRELQAKAFVELFKGDNARFNEARFLLACDIT